MRALRASILHCLADPGERSEKSAYEYFDDGLLLVDEGTIVDKASGKQVWETEIGRGHPLTKRHFKATQANSTPVTDGEHVVVVFPTAPATAIPAPGSAVTSASRRCGAATWWASMT